MSELAIRVALLKAIYAGYEKKGGQPLFPPCADDIADAILEQFEVTLRPPVTPTELGRMVGAAYADIADYTGAGHRMLQQLEERGLQIVRVDE